MLWLLSVFFFFCLLQVFKIIKYFVEGLITKVISKKKKLAHLFYNKKNFPAFLAFS